MTTKREEWTTRTTNNGPTVYDEEGNAICMVYHPQTAPSLAESEEVAQRRARRIAAVPDLEAALVGVLKRGPHPKYGVEEAHTAACWDGIHAYHLREKCSDPACEAIHAALRKAGRL